MSFFDDETVTDMVQDHIETVSSIEESQATKLYKNMKNVRSDLINRLFRAKEGTFTHQQLAGTLVQVDSYLKAMSKDMKIDMEEGALILGERGISDLVKEIRKFNKHFDGAVVPINLDAALFAQESSNLLANRYDASIDSYTSDVRQQITQGLTESVLMQDNLSRVVQKLGQFMGTEEWKVLRMARTELHNVYGETKRQGMLDVRDKTLPDLKKTLFHPMDKRTGDDSKWLNKNNLIVEVDEPFIYKWKGQKREFMAPPDRPNDRSILVPYREAWG